MVVGIRGSYSSHGVDQEAREPETTGVGRTLKGLPLVQDIPQPGLLSDMSGTPSSK